MALHITCACPTPIKGLGCIVICVKCEGGNAKTPQCEKLGLLYCMSQLGTWVGGWVGGWVGRTFVGLWVSQNSGWVGP